MNIQFYDCNKENLERVYADYVKKVTDNKDYIICTNIIVNFLQKITTKNFTSFYLYGIIKSEKVIF